jgi:hypothetical protein
MVLLSDGSNSGNSECRSLAVVRFVDFADFVVESGYYSAVRWEDEFARVMDCICTGSAAW